METPPRRRPGMWYLIWRGKRVVVSPYYHERYVLRVEEGYLLHLERDIVPHEPGFSIEGVLLGIVDECDAE